MKKMLGACLAVLLMVTGCATVKLSERNATIVMAKDAKRGEGPSGVTDRFGLEGKVVAYVTFNWDDSSALGGSKIVEAKWYAGERLVSAQKGSFSFGRPPHYVWFHLYGAGLGIGKRRVEIYVDGLYAGSRTFEIVDKL